MRAISGTRGSSGFGSVSSEQMDSNTGAEGNNKQKFFIDIKTGMGTGKEKIPEEKILGDYC